MADDPRRNPYARPTAYRYSGQAPLRPGAEPEAPPPTQRGPSRPSYESARSVVTGSPLAAPGQASVIPSLPTRPNPEAQRQAPLRPTPPAMRPPSSPVMGPRPEPMETLSPAARAPLPNAIPEPVIVPAPVAVEDAPLTAPIPGAPATRKASSGWLSGRMLALGLVVLALVGLAAAVFMMMRARPAPVVPPAQEAPALTTTPAAPPAPTLPAPTAGPEVAPPPVEPPATTPAPSLRGSQPKPASTQPAAPKPAAAAPVAAPVPDLAPAPLDLPPAPPPAAVKPPPPRLTPIPAPPPSNPDEPISTRRPN
ncbi:hypothetical protein QO010_003823 [Caulobacter ginsengisoli]|uniref:Sporulation protein n=1 Tax=Caulobacter ginsengisoli TaxID=400775 RepID=A0ABU0IVI7_9CAUL|nr:hypothetical protein [Caulobacter ginsengisoli]MDQ0466030.1 hypothetical protein [Caulobacter ginsengisoli]